MSKFNVGIAGYGWAAGAHIAAISAGQRGRVTAICSSRGLEARELSAKHGVPLQVYSDYKDGKTAKCASVIDCLQPYYFHTHLVGSEGSLLDNKFHSNLLTGLEKHHWSQLAFQPVDSGDVSDHPYQTQFDAFFAALEKNEEMPLTGLTEAVPTHEVIFAAERSLQLGRPVKLEEVHAR